MNSMNNSQRRRSVQIGTRRNDARGFQIGPRIRIGGSVGKVGQKIKEGTGKVLSNPWVDMGLSMLPGVGPGLAAAANMTGHVLDTSGGGIHSAGDVAGMVKDAGMVYGGSKIAGGIKNILGHKIPMGSILHGGGADGVGAMGAIGDIAGKVTQPHGADGAGPQQGWLDKLGGGSGLVDKALMAAAIAAAAADRQKQSQMMDEAKGYATGAYDQRAPLRDRAMASLTDPGSAVNKAPDLSSIFSNAGSAYNKVGPRVPATVQ